MIRRWFSVDWSEPLTHGWSFFYDNAGSKDKTLKLYERDFHDLLNDVGKEGVLNDIKAWITARG